MARPLVKLSDFDPEPLIEYAITERDLTNIYQYLRAMQAHLNLATWDEIGLGGYYGTSALLPANTKRPGDWHDLFDTNLPFFEPTEAEILEAEELLVRLRTLGRRPR